MLSMVLQLSALWNIIIGILTAAAAGHIVHAEIRNGKFDFCYQ
jgi:hypothetical protein